MTNQPARSASIVGNTTTSTVRAVWIVGNQTLTSAYVHTAQLPEPKPQPACK